MTDPTERELDEARAHYRGRVIPQTALAVMDAETARLALSGLASSALGVGQLAPEFTLPDAGGQPVRLTDALSRGPAVIAFYRGGWCPYCNIALQGLQRMLPEFSAIGATLLAISPQLPDQSLSTAEKNQLKFAVLSDVGNRVARAFGVAFKLSPELRELYRSFGHPLEEFNGADGAAELPVPATFVVDRQRRVRFAHVDVDYTRRAHLPDVLEAVRDAATS